MNGLQIPRRFEDNETHPNVNDLSKHPNADSQHGFNFNASTFNPMPTNATHFDEHFHQKCIE